MVRQSLTEPPPNGPSFDLALSSVLPPATSPAVMHFLGRPQPVCVIHTQNKYKSKKPPMSTWVRYLEIYPTDRDIRTDIKLHISQAHGKPRQ